MTLHLRNGKTRFVMTFEIEKGVPPVGELPPKNYGGLQIVDAHNSWPLPLTIWSTIARVDVPLGLLRTVRCRSKALEIYQ